MRPSTFFFKASQVEWERSACAQLLAFTLLLAPGLGLADVDPWEGANRKIYQVNDLADRAVLKPLARGYEWLLPNFARRFVRNVFRNVGTPSVAVNQLLQGKPRRAASDTTRFLINTTLGLAGLVDVATVVGLDTHEEDFGQTLSVWGVHNGPFLVIPFRGAATTTHALGMVVEAFANPVQLISPARDRYIIRGINIVDRRAGLLAAESLLTGDEYLFLRDAYLQRRAYLVNDGELEEDPFLDDFDEFEE